VSEVTKLLRGHYTDSGEGNIEKTSLLTFPVV